MDKLKIHFYLNYSNSERMNLEFQMGRIGFTLLEVSTKDIGCYCY